MPKKTLDRIYARINILNRINEIESEQINLELTYASIINKTSQSVGSSTYEHHDILQDIALRMSLLEEEYNNLQRNLLNLSQR